MLWLLGMEKKRKQNLGVNTKMKTKNLIYRSTHQELPRISTKKLETFQQKILLIKENHNNSKP